jgi:adenosylcobinamide-GDP ribazoletransferase
MRSLILAIQFLTRLPTPQLKDFEQRELASCAIWFPWVGLLIGAFVTGAALLGAQIESWAGALLAVLMWTWITGALHLDGLADLTDALGAAHRDPSRLLQVMRDPHVGSFGVVALILQLLCKLVLVRVCLNLGRLGLMTLPLICAWARMGALFWSATLPALPGSSTGSFTWKISGTTLAVNTLLLSSLTFMFAPLLLLALVPMVAWGWFLKRRLGGMSGDCLGAGIEVMETSLLLIYLVPVAVLKWLLKLRASA